MKPTRLLLHVTVLAGALTSGLSANSTPPFQVSFTAGSGGSWNADWLSTFPNRIFFAESSQGLVLWETLPVLEFGTGLKGVGFDNGGLPRYFFRLRHVDDPEIQSLEEAELADHDYDGLPNAWEIANGFFPLTPESESAFLSYIASQPSSPVVFEVHTPLQ